MTEHSYKKIFCSNMMKANQDLIKDGLTDQMADIFMENSERLLGAEYRTISKNEGLPKCFLTCVPLLSINSPDVWNGRFLRFLQS